MILKVSDLQCRVQSYDLRINSSVYVEWIRVERLNLRRTSIVREGVDIVMFRVNYFIFSYSRIL